jgi:DNA-binding IclR family transcriptional regulator
LLQSGFGQIRQETILARPRGTRSIGIQSVEVAGRVLNALIACGGAGPLRRIARESGMQPAKLHRYLVSLVRIGLLDQDSGTGEYQLGALAITAGLAAMRNTDVIRIASDALPSLRDRTHETATLALWTDAGPVVFDLAESKRQVFMNVRVGSVLPLTRTALGLVFAVFYDSTERDRLLRKELRERQISNASWRKTEQTIRRQGFTRISGALVPGVDAIAAPVWTHEGRLAAGIGLICQQGRLDLSNKGKPVRELLTAAKSLSSRLGHPEVNSSNSP